MPGESAADRLRERLTREGESAVGRLVQEALESPVLHAALSRALEAREKAAQAQEVAMGALNLPSASDLERLTRRVRAVSQRLEAVEDGVDRLERRLGAIERQLGQLVERLGPPTTAARPTTRRAPAKRAKT